MNKCEVCDNEIYNPEYEEVGLCSACATGESEEANPLEKKYSCEDCDNEISKQEYDNNGEMCDRCLLAMNI